MIYEVNIYIYTYSIRIRILYTYTTIYILYTWMLNWWDPFCRNSIDCLRFFQGDSWTPSCYFWPRTEVDCLVPSRDSGRPVAGGDRQAQVGLQLGNSAALYCNRSFTASAFSICTAKCNGAAPFSEPMWQFHGPKKIKLATSNPKIMPNWSFSVSVGGTIELI